MAIQPYTGPFGKPELRHLLRRCLFGVGIDDLNHFQGMTLGAVVDELFAFSTAVAPPIKAYSKTVGGVAYPDLADGPVPFGETWTTIPRAAVDGSTSVTYRNESLRNWMTGVMIDQDRNLREKLTLFWMNHAPIQLGLVSRPELSYQYSKLLRDNCKGNVRSLMKAICVDGAMLIYLNGIYNVASAPDENFGRELMELFTLGEGAGYTQSDVAAAGRIFTGWKVVDTLDGVPILPEVQYFPENHDQQPKQLSAFFNNAVIPGGVGPNGGVVEVNAFIDLIFTNEECSLFICRQLYRWFVGSQIDAIIEEEVIVPLAQIFRDNVAAPDQFRMVLRALLTSEHFFSADVRACMVKSPVDYMIGLMHTLRMPMPDDSLFEAQYAIWSTIRLLIRGASQDIGEPPNVAGWPAYYQEPALDRTWMDTVGCAARVGIFQKIVSFGFPTGPVMVLPENANLFFKTDFVDVVSQFSQPSDPNVLMQEAADLLFAIPVSTGVLQQLKAQYLLQGQVTDSYWTTAYNAYLADPNDPVGVQVPNMLRQLFLNMLGAAETQLH